MANSRVILHRQVPEDLAAIIDYFAERSLEVAERFARAVPEALSDISRFPGAGSPKDFKHPHLAGVRSWRVRGFKKYLIFYLPIPEGILVLAILHGARDLPTVLGART